MRALTNETDERLIVEAAQRDPAKFAALYEANFCHVYAYVSSRVRERHEVEDIVSEVFQLALSRLATYEWRGVPFIAWLLRIARNIIADRYRSGAREQELPADDPDNGLAALAIERRAMLLLLVEELPPEQRMVLARRFGDQRSIREIADELGRSEGAVKQLQFRALQTLRDLLRHEPKEPKESL